MGALTNKPMAFNSRNWEYSSQITNDLTDFLTPRIRVDQFSGKIYRILPTVEWISNKIRFLYLGLRNQRIISPLFSYNYTIKIDFSDKRILFNSLVILTNRVEKAFSLLKKRLANNRKKNVNLVLGGIFDANISFFDQFEKRQTKVKKFLEFPGIAKAETFFFEESNYVLFGVNPRMESPLLNLKIKESQKEIYSIGNLSYQYKVSVIDNNTFGLLQGLEGKLIGNSIAFFGISTLSLSNSYLGKKNLILPIYYLNNLLRNIPLENMRNYGKKNSEDVNLYLAPQNLSEIKSELTFAITTHFEKFLGSDKMIRIPIAGYLETNVKYINKDLESKKINSVKPSFSISDFLIAFSLFSNLNTNKAIIGAQKIINFRKKITNRLISNMIPNYLVRDPITRANHLFNKI